MLVLILVLMNTNGDDSFVWFLRLSVCFGCFSCLGWRRGAALLGWALNPLGPEGPWNTLFAVLPAERWTRELLQSRQEQLAQLWTCQQYATLWNSLLPARWLFFSFLFFFFRSFSLEGIASSACISQLVQQGKGMEKINMLLLSHKPLWCGLVRRHVYSFYLSHL